MSDLPSPAEPTSPTSRGTSDYEHRSLTSHSPQTRAPPSTVRSVLLIITCTLAMIHSVRDSFTLPQGPLSLTDFFFQTYNTSSVAIALPSIGADLHIPEARLQWLVSAYTLSAVRNTISVVIMQFTLHYWIGMSAGVLRSLGRSLWP